MASRGLLAILALSGLLAALALSATAPAATGCASALLQDWRDGRIDGAYPVACYRNALDQMPEDVRIYSSAESDIKRALLARIEAAPTTAKAQTKVSASKAKASGSKGGDGLSPLIVIAIGAALLAAVGSGLALTR